MVATSSLRAPTFLTLQSIESSMDSPGSSPKLGSVKLGWSGLAECSPLFLDRAEGCSQVATDPMREMLGVTWR